MNTQILPDELVASVAPFSALPPWIEAGVDGDRIGDALVEHVPELADGRLAACHPERLRAKGREWLARYRLRVVGPGDEETDVVLTGTLWPPSASPPPEAVRSSSVPFGDPGWRCWLPGPRLLLQVQERDEALPALPALVEPDKAARLLQSVLPGAGYPGAVVTGCRPDVVRYKPGSRCTVVVHVDYECRDGARTPPDPVVLKTHQADKGQTAWEAMSALWECRDAWQEDLTMAEPLAYLPRQRILVQGPVPERCTLKELARQAFTARRESDLAALRDELARTARALVALHRSGARYGRTATVEMEIAELEEVVERLALTVPGLTGAGEALVRRLAALAEELPPDPVVPAHHDFRPAQVLLHDGRVGFIDFDGAAMAEPALDLGRFRAKLRDIGISAHAARGDAMTGPELARSLRLQDELCDHFLASYRAAAPVSTARVELWETCDLLTAVLHAWTKVRTARLAPRLAVLRHHLGRLDGGGSAS